ncbi:MAG: PKD-like domain-containing protein [Bacteroidia bacterium]
MKKIYSLIAAGLILLMAAKTQAQVSAYTFNTVPGIYTPLTGGTIWMSGASLNTDSVIPNISIGFPFIYDRATYTTVGLSNNGWIWFGEANTGHRQGWNIRNDGAKGSYNIIASTTNIVSGAISGFGVNLNALATPATSEIRYDVIGTAPSRSFVVQYTDLRSSVTDANMKVSFQIVLNEGTNAVGIIYGACAAATSVRTGSVGLKGGNNTDVSNRSVTGGGNWATSTAGATSASTCSFGTTGTTIPTSGLTYLWQPGPALPAAAYSAIGVLHDFDAAWINSANNQDVPSNNWRSWTSSGDNSWRQSSQTTAVSKWTSTGGTTASYTGTYARFHSSDARVNQVGYMDLYIDLSTSPLSKVLDFYYINETGADSMKILFSSDSGATFSQVGAYRNSVLWSKKTINLGMITSPKAIVRFTAKGDFANDDIGVDSVLISAVSCITPPVGGTATGPSSAVAGQNANFSLTGNTGSIQWQIAANPAGPYSDIAGATNATQNILFTLPGIYYYQVQSLSAGCPNDSSNAVMVNVAKISGDDACSALMLATGANGPYTTTYATVEAGEPAPPLTGTVGSQTGWFDVTLNNTIWFKYVVPASGRISLQADGTDAQIAIWKVASCDSIFSSTGRTLVAANDDSSNTVYSSYIKPLNCLTPGDTLYIQLDVFDQASNGNYTVIVNDLGPANPSFTIADTTLCFPYTGAPLTLSPAVAGGIFSGNNVTGSSYTPAGLATDTITYTLFGCHSWSQLVYVNAVPATPTITPAGPVTACMFSNVMLQSDAPAGNTWSDTQTSQNINAGTSGTYYTIVTLNGCASDTSNMVVVTFDSVAVVTSASSVTINSGDSINYLITSSPMGAATYSWTSTVTSGSVSGNSASGTSDTLTDVLTNTGAGTATVDYVITPTSAQGCSGLPFTVTVTINQPVGIAGSSFDKNVSLYPNPVTNALTVAVNDVAENLVLKLMSMNGQETVYFKSLSNFNGKYQETIDLAQLPAGVYLLKVISNGNVSVKRIVKQ